MPIKSKWGNIIVMEKEYKSMWKCKNSTYKKKSKAKTKKKYALNMFIKNKPYGILLTDVALHEPSRFLKSTNCVLVKYEKKLNSAIVQCVKDFFLFSPPVKVLNGETLPGGPVLFPARCCSHLLMRVSATMPSCWTWAHSSSVRYSMDCWELRRGLVAR